MEGTRLLISDLDGTLLGDDKALARFAYWHQAHRPQVRLAYNSGRFYESVRDLVDSTPLPAPDAVIGGVLDGWTYWMERDANGLFGTGPGAGGSRKSEESWLL